ncbi:MAG TPA: UbiH/UbiF/VisC/COQ6 family ubiquinone biosynthesis hydroxylase [Rudaea sp.]|nr:UbiH/UbiF/VisC/COQ6 family ubiquinone biosynthesis hydroxylase [Rudaea sp.]
MSRRGVHDIAIVGAGMVGASLALRLAQEGFDVAMIETREPAGWSANDDVDLRVVALAPSSVGFLDRTGAWKSIQSSRASPFRKMCVWDSIAPGELTFDAADRGESALGYIVENRLIQSVLWQNLQRTRIALRVPAKVIATESNADRRTLTLDDGAALNARIVIAADGADSTLRDLLHIDTATRDYSQRAIVAHVKTERPHQSTAWQRFLPNATLAFLPLADGRSSIVWSLPTADAERVLALDDAAFCRELGAAFDVRLGTVNTATKRAAIPLRMRLADSYTAPRFALIGDAAHVVHPLAGQGVNLGLRDAAELADILIEARDAKRDFAAEHVLRRYERRRRSDDALSAYAFDAIQRIFGTDFPPLAALRGAALNMTDRIAPLKRALARHAAGR